MQSLAKTVEVQSLAKTVDVQSLAKTVDMQSLAKSYCSVKACWPRALLSRSYKHESCFAHLFQTKIAKDVQKKFTCKTVDVQWLAKPVDVQWLAKSYYSLKARSSCIFKNLVSVKIKVMIKMMKNGLCLFVRTYRTFWRFSFFIYIQ